MKLKGSRKSRAKRGMALVVVLSFLAILGLLTGVVGNQASLALSTNSQANQSDSTYYVAYGGLQRALLELRKDPNWKGTEEAKFPGKDEAIYTVTVYENPDPAKPMKTRIGVELPPLTKLVHCEASMSDQTRGVAGVITTGTGGTSGFGALAGSSLDIQGGLVDAFTTTGGFAPWEMIPVPEKGQIGAVDGVTKLRAKANDGTPTQVDGMVASDAVDGDASNGGEGVYTVDATASFKGETQLTDPAAMDDPVNVTYNGGPLVDKPGGGSQTLFPGHFESLHIGGAATITLEPGDYYFSGNFEMFDNSKVLTNGEVRIHVQELFAMRDHSAVNYKGDPRDCEIILTGNKTWYEWLPNSLNRSHEEPSRVDGMHEHGLSADESAIWGRMRAVESGLWVSGSIYGDVQADDITIYGDATRASGAVHYFTDLDTGTAAGTPGNSANYVYDTIFSVHGTNSSALGN